MKKKNDRYFQRYAKQKPEAHAESSKRGQHRSLKARQARKRERTAQAVAWLKKGESVADIARRLKVHPETVRRWLRAHFTEKPEDHPNYDPRTDPRYKGMFP